MNQHIEQAKRHLVIAQRLILNPNPEMSASTMVFLSMAESLVSIAKSMHAMELENEETKQPKENEDE
jgi:hypothetical protein